MEEGRKRERAKDLQAALFFFVRRLPITNSLTIENVVRFPSGWCFYTL